MSGGPPKPPKTTCGTDSDGPDDEPVIALPDPITVRDLAARLGKKPLRVLCDLIARKVFVPNPQANIGFDSAADVAQRHGVRAVRENA